ncbi:plastocyanin [Nocardioides thalensis]|uniref:Plastocyanin n=1 Tax=Nocardioides thalensis TaxID=1914755 RepID=A0A853C5G8_9ACTN|nr:cupredoxin family copper-binding protein [Nocardioides thalensis]NYJ01912.1 plastocyanin [Nocardioides thalensis]
MRVVRLLVVVLATALLSTAAPPAPVAAGGSTTVTVASMTFSPSAVSVGLGESVTWVFEDPTPHTATSDQGFWDSGSHSSGGEWSLTFGSAGTFPYHCTPHPHMKAKVVVPFKVTGGSKIDGWKLRWATGVAPEGLAYDVQYKRSGTSTWRSLRTDTAKATGLFNPTRDGRYVVRARTSNLVDEDESSWSPMRTLAID